ncbi:hypothetical protein Pmani_026176 [Petrolisthes manimaculis]|uniref:Uncharacterized protein n=1 Tax=Petrolisthes manimaculis TaxID=1843537 RepID=A0AAE1P6L5_9EUCA|nr:hypothetical protein Pmani_026176 [Petrolisthes manimaculis]
MKAVKNGKQVYVEDGDIQIKVAIANSRLYHMTNTSLYTAAQTKFKGTFSDILANVEMLSPLDSDPHPLVTVNLSVPSGRTLTLDLHPVFGVPVGGSLDLQININLTDQFTHWTPRQQTVPLVRLRATVEALPTTLHQII